MKGLDSAFSIETRMHSFNALPLGASMPVASLWLFSIEPPGRGVLSLLGETHHNRTCPISVRPSAYFSCATFATTVLSCTARR